MKLNCLGGDATIDAYVDPEKDGKKSKLNVYLVEGRDHPFLTGVLRTKPGRKDSPQTLSLSCSDKIASWNICGVQGALLSHIFAPVYLDVLIIGAGFDQASCNRALISRISDIEIPQELIGCGYKNNSLNLKIFSCEGMAEDGSIPSSQVDLKLETSSFWYSGMPRPGHIVQGFKKGSKKPVINQPFPLALQSPLSRESIFEKLFKPLVTDKFPSYEDAKISARNYQIAKAVFFANKNFCAWPVRSIKMKEFRSSLLYE